MHDTLPHAYDDDADTLTPRLVARIVSNTALFRDSLSDVTDQPPRYLSPLKFPPRPRSSAESLTL